MSVTTQVLPTVINLDLSTALDESSASQSTSFRTTQVNATQASGAVTTFSPTESQANALSCAGENTTQSSLELSPVTGTQANGNSRPALDLTSSSFSSFAPEACPKIIPTNPVEGRAKEKRTLDGIKSGKYYSMVHQFPDIIESCGRGPTNLDRTTWTMEYPDNLVPLSDRGREKNVQRKKTEKEEKQANKRKRSWKNVLKRIFGNKDKKYGGTKDLGLPLWAKKKRSEHGAAGNGMTRVGTMNCMPHPPRQYRGPRIEE